MAKTWTLQMSADIKEAIYDEGVLPGFSVAYVPDADGIVHEIVVDDDEITTISELQVAYGLVSLSP